jgi:hypothetical protein
VPLVPKPSNRELSKWELARVPDNNAIVTLTLALFLGTLLTGIFFWALLTAIAAIVENTVAILDNQAYDEG